MQRIAGLDRDRCNAQEVSNESRCKCLRAGQDTELLLGLKEEELRALSGGRCPQRGFGDLLDVASPLLPPTQA